jgi:WD40 repeat protein
MTLVVAGRCGTALVRDDGERIAWLAERFQYGYFHQRAPDFAIACAGANIAVATREGPVELRSAATGEVIRLLPGHKSLAGALAFSADGRQLASVATDRTVRVWEVDTGRETAHFEIEGPSASWLAFDPRGQYIAVSSSEHLSRAELWSTATLQRVATIDCLGGTGAQFTPDGRSLLISLFGGVTLFDLAVADQEAARQKADGQRSPSNGATAASDAPVPPHLLPATTLHETNHEAQIWGVAASRDGRWLATGAHDGLVKIWDTQSLSVVRTLRGHGGIVWCVAFSPDSRTLASGSSNSSGTVGEIKLWDVATGTETHHWEGHSRLVQGLDFHPSGKLLASGSFDGSVHLWDMERLDPLGELDKLEQPVYSVAFRPDGRALAASCLNNRVAVWDLPDLKSQFTDLQSRPPHRSLAGHTSAVYSVGWSPDGRYLASGSEQGVVIFWNADTFERVVTLKGGTGQIRNLDFSRDGHLLACGAYAAPLLIWDLRRLHATLREMNLDW